MQIFEYIRAQRTYFETVEIPVFEGKDHSLPDTINHIDHYWADTYLEEASDDIIGDYPFDNISKFRVLLEARATDFDSKHVEVEPKRPDKESRVKTMIATKAIRRWMRKYKFGQTINDICITRPKYGGVLVSKVEEGVVVDKWQNLIVDQSDVMSGPRIKRHYLTPSEMTKKRGVWENIDDALLTAQEEREKDMEGSEGETAETQGFLIEVFEVQGDIEKRMLEEAIALMKGEEYEYDPETELEFVEAKILVCGPDWRGEEGQERGIVLYAKEEKAMQKYLARNPQAGRGLGVGVVEDLFQHQKWHNFTKTEEMRMIAIAGKKLYVTDDPDILANIFDDGVDHGTVLRVGQGKQLTELNQLPTGVPVYQGMRQEWDQSADKVTSSFSSKLGEEAKAGTPFRAQYLQNLEASSQFEQYREEIGFFLQEIIEDFVLPDALKEVAEDNEIYDTFSPQELMLIDEVIVERRVTDEFMQRTLNREVVTPTTLEEIRADIEKELKRNGSKRLIEDIKDFIKDAGGSVVVHTTDEARNKAVYFESLANALALLAPEDPRRNAIIDRIMDSIGISREELELYAEGVTPSNPNPQLDTKQLVQSQQVGPSLSLAT